MSVHTAFWTIVGPVAGTLIQLPDCLVFAVESDALRPTLTSLHGRPSLEAALLEGWAQGPGVPNRRGLYFIVGPPCALKSGRPAQPFEIAPAPAVYWHWQILPGLGALRLLFLRARAPTSAARSKILKREASVLLRPMGRAGWRA